MKATTSHILTDKKRQSHLMLLYFISFQFIDTFGGTIIITMTKPLHQDVSGRACPILSCRGETKIRMYMIITFSYIHPNFGFPSTAEDGTSSSRNVLM